ncbi:sulfurtransferase TusA family protein [Achromobacter sp. GG226]|uniref:sulfurtransferase TusA family protein n=1 Tax=Verticiella alkaliphila TaxID=2779529 RepID=UPI001C0C4687|nr:sulfurtransferase TusA family protein [Verticiella sp. GG226]MBU4612560.1 sulfurtransferase TusA family protein [Verticiella sp. GG226]
MDDATPTPDLDIDTSGLTCPLPILRAKKALATLTTGQVLRVVSTDPHSMADFRAFCRQTGNALLRQDDENPRFIHYLARK